MTESECIEELLYQEKMRGKGIGYQVNNLVIRTAVDALNEIQQYRVICTVEECQEAREMQMGKISAREIARMVVEALESERETYLKLLQNEDYQEIEDELCEYLAAE